MRPLTERDEQILLCLKKMDYMTTAQLSEMLGVNINTMYRVMRGLDKYVSAFQDEGMKIYYLNREGRDVVQCDKVRRRLSTAQHYIMRNDLFLYLGQPATWRNEVRLRYVYDKNDPSSKKIVIVSDAYYTAIGLEGKREMIIEVDYQQKMFQNRAKVEKYRRLVEKGVFQNPPRFIWVTTTPHRKRALQELHDGLDVQILQRSDIS